MTPAHRTFSGVMLLVAVGAIAASYWGWGVPSDASVRAQQGQSARLGSLRGRHYYGGGTSFGK